MDATLNISHDDVMRFHTDGYIVLRRLLQSDEVVRYRELYDRFLDGVIDTGRYRADLGGLQTEENPKSAAEKITQIMWPSALIPTLVDGPLHRRAIDVSRAIYGRDMQIDFDMLINKAPHSDTITPWHQDAAYWIDLPDRRAASFWVALDEATVDSGCMWFVPGSHLKALRKHSQPAGARALQCDCSEQEGAVAIPLSPGDATIHHGGTLHYSRGNTTGGDRRAFIVNCRPEMMIRLEREQGMDHGRSNNTSKVRSIAAT